MSHLDDLALDDLRAQLDEVTEKRPTMRLMVAIAYKQGVTQTDIADWYGLSRKTVYNWLRRLEEEPLNEAVRDARRPGRPSKLTENQRAHVVAVVARPPANVGLDAEEWTPSLLQRYVADVLGVEYSVRTCRRLLDE